MYGEIWRDVPSVPGILVSSEGRVMYTPFRGWMPRGRGTRPYGGRPTSGIWNKTNGRFIIVVRGTTHKIHRLIAEAFHGPPPFDGAVAMHVDENAATTVPKTYGGEHRKKISTQKASWPTAAVAPARIIRSSEASADDQSRPHHQPAGKMHPPAAV